MLLAASTSDGIGVLCVILLIAAIVVSAIFVLGLLGMGPGRTTGGGYSRAAGPLIAAIVLWVLYAIFC